jgi:hypothetical protein
MEGLLFIGTPGRTFLSRGEVWWNKESVNLEDVFEMFFTGKTYRSMSERSDRKPRNLSLVSSFNNLKSIARKSDFQKREKKESSVV